MTMQELMLDGNAAAGALEQIFHFEITTAVGTCANCGATAEFGRTSVYVQAPGIVVRCPSCEAVLLRLVGDGGGRYWLEMTGVRCLELQA
jgi:Zn finger protein HypA/HybF involved in hydrogenase expression